MLAVLFVTVLNYEHFFDGSLGWNKYKEGFSLVVGLLPLIDNSNNVLSSHENTTDVKEQSELGMKRPFSLRRNL